MVRLKDIVEFLSEELNKSIDKISDLKTIIQKIEIDIDTSLSYTQSIKSNKDNTIDFFMSETSDDQFNNNEISNLNNKIESLNNNLNRYKEQLQVETERIADIKELINKYSVRDKDNIFDYSINNQSNINSLIQSADLIYDNVCNYITHDISKQIDILLNNNNLIISLINYDSSRASLELKKNSDILNELLESLNKFSEKIYRYNPEFGFKSNFEYLCRKFNKQNKLFSYTYNDDLNMSSRINDSKCNSYFKLIAAFIQYINVAVNLKEDDINVSRETYKVEFINYKSKSKITFVLDEMYEYIKDEYIKEKSKDIILVKYYLNASNAYVKFKKLNGKFIIEIYNDLY